MNKAWEALFKPYTDDGCTIELTAKWLMAEGRSRGFGQDVINSAMAETFMELSRGKNFLGPCNCGCQSNPDPAKRAANNVHTWINHHMLRKCETIQARTEKVVNVALEKEAEERIANIVFGMSKHTMSDDVLDMLTMIYENMETKKSIKNRVKQGRKFYRRKNSVLYKPLKNAWREDIKPLLLKIF